MSDESWVTAQRVPVAGRKHGPQHRLEIVDVAADMLAEIVVAVVDLGDLARFRVVEQPHRAAGEDPAVAAQVCRPCGVGDVVATSPWRCRSRWSSGFR